MSLHFTKMHGLGNDFIVMDAMHQTISLNKELIAALSKRNTGIGFDQCLLIERPRAPDADFFYRIFNANGQEVGQCGNGARCLMRFVQRYHLTHKKEIIVETHTTHMHLKLNEDNTVRVDLGVPEFTPAQIPLRFAFQASRYALPLNNGEEHKVHAVGIGNPHAVCVVDNINQAPVATLGKEISEHPLFPEQTNAGFMQIINSGLIHLRVFERGCGETQACGSGAVAAVAIGRMYHQLKARVKVILPGGELWVDWPDMQGAISLTGTAEFVYEGKLCE